MAKDFMTAVKDRRTYYSISKDTSITDDQIVALIHEAVKFAPSAFNSQSSRAVVLLGKQHDKLWDITETALRKIVPAEQFAPTAAKINSFRSGHGTVLYFEDSEVIIGLQEKFPAYAANFPLWSQQASGILQFIVWTKLEIEGLGASIQHYNQLIEEEVKATWDIAVKWQLIAQMPFGKPSAAPGEKEFQPLAERVKVFR